MRSIARRILHLHRIIREWHHHRLWRVDQCVSLLPLRQRPAHRCYGDKAKRNANARANRGVLLPAVTVAVAVAAARNRGDRGGCASCRGDGCSGSDGRIEDIRGAGSVGEHRPVGDDLRIGDGERHGVIEAAEAGGRNRDDRVGAVIGSLVGAAEERKSAAGGIRKGCCTS